MGGTKHYDMHIPKDELLSKMDATPRLRRLLEEVYAVLTPRDLYTLATTKEPSALAIHPLSIEDVTAMLRAVTDPHGGKPYAHAEIEFADVPISKNTLSIQTVVNVDKLESLCNAHDTLKTVMANGIAALIVHQPSRYAAFYFPPVVNYFDRESFEPALQNLEERIRTGLDKPIITVNCDPYPEAGLKLIMLAPIRTGKTLLCATRLQRSLGSLGAANQGCYSKNIAVFDDIVKRAMDTKFQYVPRLNGLPYGDFTELWKKDTTSIRDRIRSIFQLTSGRGTYPTNVHGQITEEQLAEMFLSGASDQEYAQTYVLLRYLALFGKCPARTNELITRALVDRAKREGFNRLSVGAVIKNEKGVLALKRAAHDSFAGQFVVPGGGIENGETIEQAIAREVKEETGLEVTSIEEYLGCIDLASSGGNPVRKFNFAVTVKQGDIKLSKDHEEYAWVGLDNLTRIGIRENELSLFRKILTEKERCYDQFLTLEPTFSKHGRVLFAEPEVIGHGSRVQIDLNDYLRRFVAETEGQRVVPVVKDGTHRTFAALAAGRQTEPSVVIRHSEEIPTNLPIPFSGVPPTRQLLRKPEMYPGLFKEGIGELKSVGVDS